MGRDDRWTLDALISEHHVPMLRLATRLTGRLETAEEILQEAMLRIAELERVSLSGRFQDLGDTHHPERVSRLAGEAAEVVAAGRSAGCTVCRSALCASPKVWAGTLPNGSGVSAAAAGGDDLDHSRGPLGQRGGPRARYSSGERLRHALRGAAAFACGIGPVFGGELP